jgi:hypothetical protein
MRAIPPALGLLAVALTVDVGGQIPRARADPAQLTFVSRFLDAPAEPLTQFRAVRHLEATNQRFKKHGWMDVHTELSPDGGFSFAILSQGGSNYIREKVLLPILEGERDIVSRGVAPRAALNMSNYEITGEEPAGSGLVRLTVKPRRPEMMLIDGALFVSETDVDLVRVEGRLARNPSFWTRRVDIVRRYGRVGGVRVPLSVQSIAQVRIAGRSEMTMTYQYEMVNGQVVDSSGSGNPP